MEATTITTHFKEDDLNSLANAAIEIEKNPLTFLRKNGKEGLNIIKGMFSTVFLFGFVNFMLLIYSVYKYFMSESETLTITYLLIAVFGCILFAILGYIKSYRNAITKATNLAYDKFNFLLKKLCILLVERVNSILNTKKEDIKSDNIKKLINLQEIYDKIFSKLPKFIVKGLTMLLNRIPILELVLEFKSDIQAGNNNEASNKLFTKIDTQIKEGLLSEASKSWVYWLLPLNIIVILGFILFKF